MLYFSLAKLRHRRLLLKLDKQIGGTIYQPFLAMNKVWLGGGGAVHKPHWMQTSTTRKLHGYLSSFNNVYGYAVLKCVYDVYSGKAKLSPH